MNPNQLPALPLETRDADADGERLHTQFAALTAFAMSVIAVAAGLAVLY